MRARGTLVATMITLCGLGAVTGCGGAQGAADARGPVGTGAAADATAPTAGSAAVTRTTKAAGGAAEAKGAQDVERPLKGKVVVIDPGHNGANYKDPDYINKPVDVLTKKKACDTTGTSTDDGYSEAAFNWDVANRMAKALRAAGATVKLTRDSNNGVGPCITQRAAIGNKAKADAAISIHADGATPTAHGFHVIIPKKINGPVDPVVADSKRLGIDIRDAIRAGTGLPYSTYIGRQGLDYRNDLGGLNLSSVPKVFVECGNMRNPSDAAKFKDPKFRQRLGVALANGMEKYLG
ncbi:N-acetylmuramoyl-L-alanine amidase [Thermopolyspora sp. NPDC052614]|uniref:N-acetylmuramoyl-L-alanine amidase n=1 Tax=Thermopolyspora sp. NPDC052614 TaxID=3155682 RepID=UPI003439D46A